MLKKVFGLASGISWTENLIFNMFGCFWNSVVHFISAAETAKKSFCPSGLNLPELLKNDGENCGLMLNTRNSGFSGYEYDITFKPGSKPLLDMVTKFVD